MDINKKGYYKRENDLSLYFDSGIIKRKVYATLTTKHHLAGWGGQSECFAKGCSVAERSISVKNKMR